MEHSDTLATLEANLRKEAQGYLRKCNCEVVDEGWIRRSVVRFTGCEIDQIGRVQTIDRISRLLSSQVRWSRTRHPRYDLNRHISLRRLLKALEASASVTRT